MKSLFLLCALAFGIQAAEVSTQIAVFNPVLGMRLYPTVEVAETAAPIEAKYLCSMPDALPQCGVLANQMTFGLLVVARSANPAVRAYEIAVQYKTAEGTEHSKTEFFKNEPEGASKLLWIGKVTVTDLAVNALQSVQ